MVDASLDVTAAHDIAHRAQDRLVAAVARLETVTVHVSPSPTPDIAEGPSPG